MPTSINTSIDVSTQEVFPGGGPEGPEADSVLVEDGSTRLLEDGDSLLLG